MILFVSLLKTPNVTNDSHDSDYVPFDVDIYEEGSTSDNVVIRRPERPRSKKKFYDYVTYLTPAAEPNIESFSEETPTTVAEAMAKPDGSIWKQAMLEEMKSLEENETWDLVNLPEDCVPV